MKRAYLRAAALTLALLTSSALLMSLLEPTRGFFSWLWWAVVTTTTVGYGDISPETAVGRTVAAFNMVLGIGLLGFISGEVASTLVDNQRRKERGLVDAKAKNHIIFYGWNQRSKAVLAELRGDTRNKKTPVVILSKLQESPVDDPHCEFVRGDGDEESLHKAGIARAQTIIFFGDDTLDPQARDGQVIVGALSAVCLNQDIYSVAELSSKHNIDHCRRAGVDEIVVANVLGSHLLASAAMDHGVSRVVRELVSNQYGSDLHSWSSTAFGGRTFIDVLMEIKTKHNSIAVAVQRGSETHTNPAADFVLEQGDDIVVVKGRRPS